VPPCAWCAQSVPQSDITGGFGFFLNGLIWLKGGKKGTKLEFLQQGINRIWRILVSFSKLKGLNENLDFDVQTIQSGSVVSLRILHLGLPEIKVNI
jgi:hypothetical protein